MPVTIKDLKDSLNPLKPKKYLKARLKISPYVLGICSLLALAAITTQLVIDPSAVFKGTYSSTKPGNNNQSILIASSYPYPKQSTISTGILTKRRNNGWKIFQSANNYEFSFPSDWIESTKHNSYADNINLIYYADGKEYIFSVGDGGREGPLADEIRDTTIFLDNNRFTKRSWIKDGYTFFVAIIPETNSYVDSSSTVSNNVENINYTLPKNNNAEYQALIDQVVATFKFFDKN